MPTRRFPASAFAVVFAALAVVHLAAQWFAESVVANATQWLLMPVLAVALLLHTEAPRGRLVSLTLLALGFSWLGDTAPDLVTDDASFLVLVGCFLLAQLAYIVAFAPFWRRSVWARHRWLLLPYGVAVGALVAACAPYAGPLLVPMLVYGACLGTMAVLSTGVNRRTAAGGALFLVSDGLIALRTFVPDFELPHGGFWVMATYIAAQALLAAGVAAARPNATAGRRASGGVGPQAA